MSAAKKTEDKRKLAAWERIRALDAKAKAWAEERGELMTAATWREMMEAKHAEAN